MKRRREEGQKSIAAFLKSPRGAASPTSEEGSDFGAASPPQQSRFASCPICGCSFPFYAIERHVVGHDGEQKQAEVVVQAESKDMPSTPSNVAAKEQPGLVTPPGKNAFHEMLSSAKSTFTPKKHLGKFMLTCDNGAFLPVFIMNAGSPETAALEASLPEPAWSCVVEIRNFVNKNTLYLTLCTNIPSEETDVLPKRDGMPPSLMKSMIQKACRLCNPNAAAHLSLELMRISPDEVLRRLTIIALEDGCLHPASPVLVWLMIALTKEYKAPLNLYRVVVRIAAEIAACKWKEPVPSDAFGTDTVDVIQLMTQWQLQAEESNQLSLLYASTLVGSILMRVSYGGMAFDMQMLRKFSVAWMKRFNGSYEVPEGDTPETQEATRLAYLSPTFTQHLDSTYYGRLLLEAFASIELSAHLDGPMLAALNQQEDSAGDTIPTLQSPLLRLQTRHLIPAGVDFHVSDVVNQVLQRTPPQALQDLKRLLNADDSQLQGYIRTAMWHFRSSVNHKKVWPLPAGELEVYRQDMRDDAKKKALLVPLWSAIRGIVIAYSEQHLQRQFARIPALA